MTEPPDYARLQAAHDAIPEFAGRTDYDLRRRYEHAQVQRLGLWSCYLADSGPDPHVAFASAYERNGAFYLWLLGVRPDFRRNGLAASLLNCYRTEGRKRGYTTFVAHAHSEDSGMVHLLESNGFCRASLGLEVIEVRGETCARELLAFSLQE